jgi:ZIP family zinc transporter
MPGAALLGAAAAASLLVGALIALRFTLSRSVVGRFMGFGAGALIAALAYELIPDASVDEPMIWVCFAAGALLYYGLDGFVERRLGGGGEQAAGPAIALGALLDGIPESIVLGIGVAVGGSASIGFFAAVFVSNVPESLSATAALRSGHSTARILGLWGSIVLASALAAALGHGLATALPGVDGRYVQALAAGGVLTMLADSMMPEAYREGGRPIALLTALGFGLAAVLSLFD